MNIYSTAVLRYSPGRHTGEVLNLGVVVVGATQDERAIVWDETLSRVRGAYPNVDANVLRKNIRDLTANLKAVAFEESNTQSGPACAYRIVLSKYSDQGLALWATKGPPVKAESLLGAKKIAFNMMVGQYNVAKTATARTDSELWKDFLKRSRAPAAITRRLRRFTFSASGFEIVCQRTLDCDNRKVVIESCSLDYAKPDAVVARINEIIGKSASLSASGDYASMMVVLSTSLNENKDLVRSEVRRLMAFGVNVSIYDEAQGRQFLNKVGAMMSRRRYSASVAKADYTLVRWPAQTKRGSQEVRVDLAWPRAVSKDVP